MLYRSALYVPADRPDRFGRALGSGADSVIFDLEDAVAPDQKAAALAYVNDLLATAGPPSERPPIWVRVNPGGQGLAEVDALATNHLVAGFCLAKASADQVRAAGVILERQGSHAVLAPLIEDAKALLRAEELTELAHVVRLQLGEADLIAQLGITPSAGDAELLAFRSQLVLVSGAAGLDPPFGPVHTDFRDDQSLRSSSEMLLRLGYFGRSCIHPRQIPVVNEVFTPSVHAVRRAEQTIAAMAGGAVGSVGGQFVDAAVARQAHRVLDIARRLGLRTDVE